MQNAELTWEAEGESLESVERRIHDGVPVESLKQRANNYARQLFELFPAFSVVPTLPLVEVGPGVGYIMEAMRTATDRNSIIGLDVSRGMIGHALLRLRRDGLSAEHFQFVHYDGVTFPWPDETIGGFYSVATIQHVPKPFAYNILFEMQRCLAKGGWAAVHLLHWRHLEYSSFGIRDEIVNQVRNGPGHWHHYWDEIELDALATYGITPSHFVINTAVDSVWLAWRK